MATRCRTAGSFRRPSSPDYVVMPGVRNLDQQPEAEYSRRLRNPGDGLQLDKMWGEYRAVRAKLTEVELAVENQKDLEMKAAYENKTTTNCQMAQLRREVKAKLQQAEEELEMKRSKLKEVILKENSLLFKECDEKVRNLPRLRFEEKKRRAEEILKRLESEKGGEVQEKYEQMERENSQELKEKISLIKRLEAAEIQKQQICEKKIQLQREEEFDKYWLEMQKKRDEERLKYEEEEEKLRWIRVQEQREVLNKQILVKKMMKDEMKEVIEREAALMDKVRDLIREEEEQERKFREIKKKEEMLAQQAQLADCRRLKHEKKMQEKAVDEYFLKKLQEEIQEEKLKISDNRAELRREAEFFIQQLKEIKAIQAEEQRQIEELREQETKKKEDTIKNNQLKLKEARDKLQRETLESWKQQLLYKQNKIDAEKSADALYDQWSNDLFQKNRDLDQSLRQYKREAEAQRIKNLEWQHNYEKLLKERELRDDNETKARKEKEDRERNQDALKSIEKGLGMLHPMTKVIYDNQ